MTAFSGSRNLLLSVFKRRLCLDQTRVFRNVCSIRTDQRHNPRLEATAASRQRWPQVYFCHLNTQRGYSDVHSEHSNSDRDNAVFQGESPEMDGDSTVPSQRSSETFTIDVLVSLLRQENAVDLCVIRCPNQIKYADYFIIATGISQRHIRAMALYAVKVYKFLKKDGDPNVKIEGKDSQDWMCIDFGNMVVHFMLPETRDVYELEKLWTLRNYDEQLRNIPAEKLPEDFIYDVDIPK